MSSIEYFINQAFSLNVNTSLYAQNLSPGSINDYDYVLTFPGQLGDFFSTKVYQQDSNTIAYVPLNPDVDYYMGSNRIGATNMGSDIYISNDGLVMAVGGRYDNNGIGAVWIWKRVGINWIEQIKLIGTGYTGLPQQGMSVALSSDGSTIAFGGHANNNGIGAVWIFVKSPNSDSWSQEQLIIPNDNIGNSNFGKDISLSNDGNTLAIGGNMDNDNMGAVWIYTRSNSSWTKQQKIYNNITGIEQGFSVSLTNDGNTLAYGAPKDSSNTGAVWIWTRTNSTWTQQIKIVGVDNNNNVISNARQGYSIQISGDGNTLAFGGPTYNTYVGAVWIWTYSLGVWTQENLISSNSYSFLGTNPYQGYSLTLSDNGNKLVVGTNNNTGMGSIWVYSRSGTSWLENDWLIYSGHYGDSREGMRVSMSGDGLILIVSAPNDNNYEGIVWSFVNSNAPFTKQEFINTAQNDIIVTLGFNTNYYNTKSNNVLISGGKYDVQLFGTNGLESIVDFNTRVLEILAIKIFGNAKSRAAIKNDTDIVSNIKSQLADHINFVVNKHKYDIFNKYIYSDNPNINANDINNPVEFNFNDDSLSFPGYIVGSLMNVEILSNALLNGPNVGGNVMINGQYNIPILIKLGNV